MPKKRDKRWEYEALDDKGHLHSDIVIADDYKEVIEICIKRGLFPRDIRQLSKQAAANYGQIPKLKALKRALENPPKPKPEFASMPFHISEEKPKAPRTKIEIDWFYVGFMTLLLVLILGSIALQQ